MNLLNLKNIHQFLCANSYLLSLQQVFLVIISFTTVFSPPTMNTFLPFKYFLAFSVKLFDCVNMIGALCFLVKLTADKLSANTSPLARIALLLFSNDAFAICSAVSYRFDPYILFPLKPFSGSWLTPPIAISLSLS